MVCGVGRFVAQVSPNMDEKNAITYAYDGDNVHMAWFSGKKVVAFEHTPTNYPSGGVVVFENLKEYCKAIRGIEWIVDGVRSRKVRRKLEELERRRLHNLKVRPWRR